MKSEIRLSPMTRLYAAFDLELRIDKLGILNNLREKYIDRLAVAEQKRDSLLKSVFVLDAAIAILISGKTLTIPFFDLTTSELPAVLEIVTATSAISAIFFAIGFINWASYDAIVNQFAIREAKPSFVDPDFIQAAERHTELTLKLFRKKFNTRGIDYHEPGRGFVRFSALIDVLVRSLFILFPLLHYTLTAMSFIETVSKNEIGFVYIVYFGVVCLANLLAFLLFVGAYHDFRFFVETPGDDSPFIPAVAERTRPKEQA